MSFNLRAKILAIVVAPVVVILALGVGLLGASLAEIRSLERLRPLATLSRDAAGLVHELQKERGQTVGMISSDYAPDALERVQAQRGLVDPRVVEFTTSLGRQGRKFRNNDMRAHVEALSSQLGGLQAHRDAVDARTVTVRANVATYTTLIEGLIAFQSLALREATPDGVLHEMLPLHALTSAKEHAGLERAIGSAVLVRAEAGRFSHQEYSNYKFRLDAEKAMLATFEDLADPEQRGLVEEALNNADGRQVEVWREVLADLPQSRDTQGIKGAEWFAAATQRINHLRDVEEVLLQRADDTAAKELSSAWGSAILVGLTALLASAAAVAGASVLAFRISERVKRVIDAALKLADGDFAVELPRIQSGDELEAMGKALETFRLEAQEKIRLQEADIRRQKEQQEHKNREVEERAQGVRQMGDWMKQELFDSVRLLQKEMGNLSGVATDMSFVCDQVRSASADADESANASATLADELASSAQELSESISEVSSQTSRTSEFASEAERLASESKEVVGTLNEATESVSEVVQLISDIAEQTNLLALNATIEAARAGDAGRGFAVVASEVKGLADQTQRSTAEIDTQVEAMQEVTQRAVDAIEKIADKVLGINSGITSAASAVEQQSAGAQTISTNVQESRERARSVTDSVKGVARDSEAMNQLANQVLEATSNVETQIGALDTKLNEVVARLLESVERRGSSRVPAKFPCEISAGGRTFEAELLNLSQGGACFIAPPSGAALGNGMTVRVVCRQLLLDESARVVSADQENGAHCQFTNLSADAKQRIEKMVRGDADAPGGAAYAAAA